MSIPLHTLDNFVACVLDWNKKLAAENLHAATTILSGKITPSGALVMLKRHGNQLQIIHSELEKVINKAHKDKFQEGDMIEFLDGSRVWA